MKTNACQKAASLRSALFNFTPTPHLTLFNPRNPLISRLCTVFHVNNFFARTLVCAPAFVPFFPFFPFGKKLLFKFSQPEKSFPPRRLLVLSRPLNLRMLPR